ARPGPRRGVPASTPRRGPRTRVAARFPARFDRVARIRQTAIPRAAVAQVEMQHETDLINIVAVGLATAFVLGALTNRLRMSPLVGYLVAGIIVGPFTPGFVADQELANQLAEIGVMLLMFGVGLHFSLKDLMEVKAIAIPGAIAQITVATVLGWGLAVALGWPILHGVIFGFSLATASTVVLLRAM